jgi:hypothetical protein
MAYATANISVSTLSLKRRTWRSTYEDVGLDDGRTICTSRRRVAAKTEVVDAELFVFRAHPSKKWGAYGPHGNIKAPQSKNNAVRCRVPIRKYEQTMLSAPCSEHKIETRKLSQPAKHEHTYQKTPHRNVLKASCRSEHPQNETLSEKSTHSVNDTERTRGVCVLAG